MTTRPRTAGNGVRRSQDTETEASLREREIVMSNSMMTGLMLVIAFPIGVLQAWAFMLIYNAFIPALFNAPRIPSIWWAAGIVTLVTFFSSVEYTGDKTEEERLKRGCTSLVVGAASPLIALVMAWLWMQLGGISQ